MSNNYTNQPEQIDPKLLEFATEAQSKHIKAIMEHGSVHAASRETGFDRSTIQAALKKCKASARRRGWSPEHDMTHTAPEGFSVVGTTTLHHEESGQVMQWVRTKVDSEKQAELA